MADLKRPTQELVFGAGSSAVTEGRICSIQSISGSGALRLAGELVLQHLTGPKVVYISHPSWAIHKQMYTALGFTIVDYPYWIPDSKSIDVKGMIECLETAEAGSLVILHPCAHNPTGMDPTQEQWHGIVDVVKRRQLLPLLDSAYQGFASGCLDEDSFAIRLFERSFNELFVCQSFAKNLGLYGERVGMLHVVCDSASTAAACLSQLKHITRTLYSSPPVSGARLALGVLTDATKHKLWMHELKGVATRIKALRQTLVDGLTSRGTPGNWDHITRQCGMFSFTGLSPSQCERLVCKWHVYLLKNGRISLAGLNNSNIEYVMDAIDEVVRAA
eukprot:GHVS01094951.1.p1 GENE.GHVS01094951.1~~GHVS01094951.1.p1  ORF type:complete len:332 (+),score=34.37 GHVS01094951.1:157-1152(+)